MTDKERVRMLQGYEVVGKDHCYCPIFALSEDKKHGSHPRCQECRYRNEL